MWNLQSFFLQAKNDLDITLLELSSIWIFSILKCMLCCSTAYGKLNVKTIVLVIDILKFSWINHPCYVVSMIKYHILTTLWIIQCQIPTAIDFITLQWSSIRTRIAAWYPGRCLQSEAGIHSKYVSRVVCWICKSRLQSFSKLDGVVGAHGRQEPVKCTRLWNLCCSKYVGVEFWI